MAEQIDKLLIKNHETRSTGSAPLLEVTMTTPYNFGRGSGCGHGCGHGQGRNNPYNHGGHNHNSKNMGE